jgi:magnesium-transporting ATPase (P-type)
MVTERDGLTGAEARRRLDADGPNELPPPPSRSAIRRFADQLLHFFALMLWVAAALAVVADLPQLAIAIAIVIVLNAAFAFVQEHRADQAAARLRALLPRRVTVVRDGVRGQVDAREVVVDDLLVLEAGDRVPADALVVDDHGLHVDTSLLTGESEPSVVESGTPVLAGTFVVEGQAEAVVTATGAATRLAAIARLTTATPAPPSPLSLELHRTVRAVAVIATAVGAVFFALSLLVGDSAAEGFVLAIGVTVALVPEALLPTVTLSLSWGAEQMARRRVLVRHLEAVETLGSTTFICTDKTGTLTRNQMTVVEAWTPGGTAAGGVPGYDPTETHFDIPQGAGAIADLAATATRCSSGFVRQVDGAWVGHGDPMEVAIDVFARRLGLDTERERSAVAGARRFPFDPRRRRMSVVTGREVVVKGAPEAVLPRCGEEPAVHAVLDRYTGAGLRVLAVARRELGGPMPSSADEAEAGLVLVGLLALEDPPRPDVAPALVACRRAGIKVVMVTGDHPATAAAIGDEVGLRTPGSPIVSGEDLPTDEAALGELLDQDGLVVARVAPEDKLRIARALRARGHVVAMTGDGVNDGPALHVADIGVAMGASGTDVAREAADLVLLDDHFASIVAGIEQGRATFLNVRRFLTYHLTDNVAELTPFLVWALSGGRVPLALGVLQILALDIGTDTLSAVALGAEPPAHDVLDRPPVSGRLLNRTVARRAFGLLGPAEAVLAMVAFLTTYVAAGWRPGDPFPGGDTATAASGAAFLAVVLAQAANAFACRSSTRWPGRLGWTTNRLLPLATLAGLTVSAICLVVPPVAHELGQRLPTVAGWTVAATAPAFILAIDALDKARRRGRHGTGRGGTVRCAPRDAARTPPAQEGESGRWARISSAADHGSSSPATTRSSMRPRPPSPRRASSRAWSRAATTWASSTRSRSRRRSARPPVDSRWRRWAAMASHNGSAPSPVGPAEATVATTGGRHAPRSDRSSMLSRSRTVCWAPWRSALFTTKTSPISMSPALLAWTASPQPGLTTTTVVSAAPATSTSTCPTPTVSTTVQANPAAARTRRASGAARASPPRWPRVAMERMNTPSSRAWSPMRTRSPRIAPPV